MPLKHCATVVEPAQSICHSSRQRQPPKRLQYSSLGNPLISVVQTLFHSLADACGEAFTSPASNTAVCSRVHVVQHAPELHGFKGGACNPDDKCHLLSLNFAVFISILRDGHLGQLANHR